MMTGMGISICLGQKVVGAVIPPDVVPPYADYRIDEGMGGSLTDSSGNGFTATLAGGTETPSWVPEGLSFDGGDRVILPFAAINRDAGYFECVARLDSTADVGHLFYTQVFAFGPASHVEIVQNSGNDFYWIVGSTTGISQTIPSSVWIHVGIHWFLSSVEMKVIINGSVVNTVDNPFASILGTINDAMFGREPGDSGGWNGPIALVRIYNQTLDASQIAGQYTVMKALAAAKGIALP